MYYHFDEFSTSYHGSRYGGDDCILARQMEAWWEWEKPALTFALTLELLSRPACERPLNAVFSVLATTVVSSFLRVHRHHLSSPPHPSSFPPPPFLIAAVPIAPPLLFLSPTAEPASGDPNVSQKSLRAGGSAAVRDVPPRAAPSSMKRFSVSAAPLVLVWRVCPTEAAVRRACVARSASASCEGGWVLVLGFVGAAVFLFSGLWFPLIPN